MLLLLFPLSYENVNSNHFSYCNRWIKYLGTIEIYHLANIMETFLFSEHSERISK